MRLDINLEVLAISGTDPDTVIFWSFARRSYAAPLRAGPGTLTFGRLRIRRPGYIQLVRIQFAALRKWEACRFRLGTVLLHIDRLRSATSLTL